MTEQPPEKAIRSCRASTRTTLWISLISILSVLVGGSPSAENLDLEEVTGGELKTFRETASQRPRLFNFWATWCGPCTEEMPDLVSLARKYSDRIELITVSANDLDEIASVRQFLEEFQPPGRNLILADSDIYGSLKAFDREWKDTLPFTALVDFSGEIVYRREGLVDISRLERNILGELKDNR